MKLVHPILSAPIVWRENCVPVVVLEDPTLFRRWVFTLTAQAQGENGAFVLSQEMEELECEKHLFVIKDYYDLSLESRTLQTRFQALLQHVAREELAEESDQLDQAVQQYLNCIATALDYPISYTEGEYSLSVLKAVKCHPCLDGDTPLERLVQYLQFVQGLIKDPCFVLVFPHIYFSEKELIELYRMAAYHKMKLLMLENSTFPTLPGEEYTIIDAQMCELRVDLWEEVD